MTRIFICTHPRDAHALIVQLALEDSGHTVFRWLGGECPSFETHTFELDRKASYVIHSRRGSISLQDFDAVWWRRQNEAILPSLISPADAAYAQAEWKASYSAIWTFFRSDAFWVNPWKAQKLADLKLLQLCIAHELGMPVPRTIVSNNAHDIRRFVASEPQGAIHKMLEPASWKNERHYARARTSRVRTEHLHNDLVLSLCPGVFQERIKKQLEIRATFFGAKCLAVSIEPMDADDGSCDWRSIPHDKLRISATDLPAPVHAKCLELMHRLGIVFGCFDFLVNEQGDYIFLEVNENGQFLWIEALDPSIPMLETFCRFLSNESPARSRPIRRFADYHERDSYRTLLNADEKSPIDSKFQLSAAF